MLNMSDVKMHAHQEDTTMEWSDCEQTKMAFEHWVYVDLQGFKVNKNRFMCKEFCLLDGNEKFHAIVKSWFPHNKLLYHYKRQIEWLSKYFHGLTYDCGDMDIDQLTEIVYPKLVGKTVIVKGSDKINWLKYIFRNYGDISCRNIEDLDYDIDETEQNKCEYHNEQYPCWKYRCAMSNALKLQDTANKNAPFRYF